MSNRPALLEDTASVPGFAHLDPMSQWFLGGTGASPATATGISDDTLYALDVKNVGSGGFSFRATSGNGVSVFKLDNTGASFSNGLGVVAGTAAFGGPATFATSATFGATIDVTGAATFRATLTATGAATFGATVDVTGVATFRTSVNVLGNATFTANAILQQQLLSNIALGAAPMTFTSSTMCPNLNAQYAGGHTVVDSAGGIATYDGSGRVLDSTRLGGVAVGGFLQTSGGTIASLVVSGALVASVGTLTNGWTAGGILFHTAIGGSLGFFGSTPNTKQTVTGARGGNAALASLLSALGNYGIVLDSTSA